MGNAESGANRIGGDKNNWDARYLEVAKKTISDENLNFDTSLSKKQRAGFKELIKNNMGKKAFGAFLENKQTGLSFWLDPDNLEKFKSKENTEEAEARIAGSYKNLSGNTKKMLGRIVPVSALGKAGGLMQFQKGQESVINVMCLDLYPQFLNSEYFERLKTKGGGREVHKAQQKYKALASKRLESPLQWLLRFAEIAERVYECICISDPTLPDCPVVYVNKAFHICTGYARSEVLGRNCRFLQGPRTTVDTKSQLREDIHSGEDTKCKILNYRKNGEQFYNLLSMKSVVIKGQTKPRFVIAIQFDLSLKRTPLELFQLETVLGLIPDEFDVMFDKTLTEEQSDIPGEEPQVVESSSEPRPGLTSSDRKKSTLMSHTVNAESKEPLAMQALEGPAAMSDVLRRDRADTQPMDASELGNLVEMFASIVADKITPDVKASFSRANAEMKQQHEETRRAIGGRGRADELAKKLGAILYKNSPIANHEQQKLSEALNAVL